jgi:Tfp pilus assembly protein FimT
MVVLVVTAVMMGASAPALNRYLKTHQLIGATENFAADLRLCRQRALAEGNNFVFSWNADDRTYTILDDENNNGTADAGEGTIGPRELPDGITLTNGPSSPFSGPQVTFTPGGAASEAGQVTLADEHGLSRQILLIRATGLVKVL